MFIGPILTREAVTAPRRVRHYVARAVYVAALLLLMCTAWLVLTGTQEIRNLGDLARFSMILFQLLAPLQLILALFFSALSTASSISREKDRGTLILLLTTDLNNRELVLGKLLSSMLTVLVLITAALPLFVFLMLLGGIQGRQIAGMFFVTLMAALASGSLGATMALWREKTFQTLSLTILVLVAWLGLWEAVALLPEEMTFAGFTGATWSIVFSPWRAVIEATRPILTSASGTGLLGQSVSAFLIASSGIVVVLNAIAIWKIRRWNPSREVRRTQASDSQAESIFSETTASPAESPKPIPSTSVSPSEAKQPSRTVWNNPVAWREIRTWAYGRKILVVRVAYLILFSLAAAALLTTENLVQQSGTAMLLPLFLLSLVLINAQAVTSFSTERDAKTLDLLLVTDLSPQQIIFGKLGGILFNTKEMILLPILLCLAMWLLGMISGQNTIYVVTGLLVMDFFVAVLGVHCGLIHENSRIAIGTSLGTVFFLFVGIAICMRIMVAFSGAFEFQLAPFLAFILGGGVGLYVSLGARNASSAIFWASFTCPFLTFWAITSFLQQQTLGVLIVTALTYGFTAIAMLIPALSEFDVASGRTSGD